MLYENEHFDIQKTVKSFIDKEVNPFIEDWEEAKHFPAKELFKKMGDLGLLGINKPTEYGGLGLDYSYELIFAEEMGRGHNGSIPMAVGVQTDMATPALARFGSDELKKELDQ